MCYLCAVFNWGYVNKELANYHILLYFSQLFWNQDCNKPALFSVCNCILTCWRTSTRMGIKPALMTIWIWMSLPAVILESVQAASFWILGLWWRSKSENIARTPAFRTHWVCSSVPVTMLPSDRRAGVWGGGKKKRNQGKRVDSRFMLC